MSFDFHIGFSFSMEPIAKPTRRLMSYSLMGFSNITPPRSQDLPSVLISICICSLLMTWTSVLLMFIVNPNFYCLLSYTSTFVTGDCTSSDSAKRTKAKRRLLMYCPWTLAPICSSWIASLSTNSSRMLKSWGNSMHPWHTLVIVVSQDVSSPFTLTAFSDNH